MKTKTTDVAVAPRRFEKGDLWTRRATQLHYPKAPPPPSRRHFFKRWVWRMRYNPLRGIRRED